MRGSVLEKEGEKNPSDWLMSSWTFRQHPSFFMTVAKERKKKAASDVFSFGSKRGCVIEFTEAAEYFGGIN